MGRTLVHEQQRARPQKPGSSPPRGESERCPFRNIMCETAAPANRCPPCPLNRDVQSVAVMPIDTQWFIDRLAERRLSQRQLAKLMGLDSAAVSYMLRGKRKMSVDEAAQLAVLLQSSTQDILRAAGAPVHTQHLVPVVGFVGPDGRVAMDAEGAHDMIEAPPHMPPDTQALQFRTAGTERDGWDGWLAFLSQNQKPPDQALGSMALVAIKHNGLHLAVIKRGYRRGTYNLSDMANRVTENMELAWACPILWIKTTA
jgi:hypothetical protein